MDTKTCLNCGNEIDLIKYSQPEKAKYCSRKCTYQYNNRKRSESRPKLYRPEACLECGKKFEHIKLNGPVRNYCSEKCMHKVSRKQEILSRPKRYCVVCGSELPVELHKKGKTKYCSNKCQHKLFNETLSAMRMGQKPRIVDKIPLPTVENFSSTELSVKSGETISTSTVGTMGELIATIDLISKNWEVFHHVSPTSSCDLIAVKNNTVKRIEVRAGTINPNSKKVYFKRNTDGFTRVDCYAVVTGLNDVYYFPGLEATEDLANIG